MKLEALIHGLDGLEEYEIRGDADKEIGHLTLDNRECVKGSLFFAIRGLETDGHKYIAGALANGAAAAVVEEFTSERITQIKVPDSRRAMSLMAAAFYGNPAQGMSFVGVTGTNGKTSITFMLRHALNKKGLSVGLIGTSGIFINGEKQNISIKTSTTPDPIELQYILRRMRDRGVKSVVMEVTAQALYLRKVEGIIFDVGIFTNLTQDHLEFFGDMQTYAEAKLRLFEPGRCKKTVVNIDDETGRRAAAGAMTYALDRDADIKAENIIYSGQGSSFDLIYKGEIYQAKLKISGRFSVYNALAAFGALTALGLEAQFALKCLGEFPGVPGRFETPDMQGRPYSVVIDYAHTPDGLENILKAVKNYHKGRIITVFGCGGNRDTGKRPIMGEIAARYSDFCVITSDNPRYEEPMEIMRQIEKGLPAGYTNYKMLENRRSAILFAMENAHAGDIIIIAGKGDEDYQEIGGVKHHFSDRETVASLLNENAHL